MVVIKDGCLKGAKGVFGDLVVYQLGGQTVVRRRGERGKQVFSEGQRAQQVRMSAVAFLWKAVRAAGLDKAWCGAMKGLPKTGYNEFVRVNVAIFRKRGCIGDFEKLQLTAGPLLLPNDLKLGRDEDGGWDRSALLGGGDVGGRREDGLSARWQYHHRRSVYQWCAHQSRAE